MEKKIIVSRVFDTVAAVFFIVWFFLPVAPGPIAAGTEAVLFKPYSMPFAYAAAGGSSLSGTLLFLVYLAPLLGLYRIASLFFLDKLGPFAEPAGLFLSIGRILVTIVAVYAFVLPALNFADSRAWFRAVPVVTFVSLGVAIAVHIVSITVIARLFNNRNPVYREYRAFKDSHRMTVADGKTRKAAAALEVLFRIRTKLFVAFIGIISIILIVLSTLLLRSYRITILDAVGDAARGQVEQASANYRINLGDSIAMFEYLNRQGELNAKAEFSYETMTLFTSRTTEVYVDDIAIGTPEFRAEYSTLLPGKQYPDLPGLPTETVREYANLYSRDRSVITVSDEAAGTIAYVSPIIKVDTVKKGEERIKRERLLGLSVMTFNEAVILKPYYRTRVTVVVCTIFFLYLAVILTYLVGNYIVNPLLFLRMNVRKISDILTTMIRGQSRVSSATLVYNDCVTSHDELKSLSTEINDMVTVIRGIVPYISASTLKQAEKGAASTTRKELSFLFTDIRGFTTLCEGMQPEEVVGVLNSYLDLETEIILNNHGDVDKFVGDEMMAFFEGPLKEVNACRAAMQIRHAMMEEKERREKDGQPVVSIGIGINSGDVVFGSVGARDRMDFTSIGDTVNLAARLEGANKAYGSKSIITEVVHERVKDNFLCRELDFIAVKGKNEPVRIYEILQEIPQAQPKLLEIKKLFEKGLAEYRAGHWEKALVPFKKNVELYGDAPSSVFIERVEHFMHNPPPKGWDGVFRMTVK